MALLCKRTVRAGARAGLSKTALVLALTCLPWAAGLAAPRAPAVPEAPTEEWGPFRYAHSAGVALRPRDSATGWSYGGAGCVSAEGGNAIFVASLSLPVGSRVDYLRLYYFDTSANDGTAWLTTYDGAGGFQDLISVSTSGSDGYGSALSPYLGHLVDKQVNAYVLNWQANQTGSSMRLCGFRVAYRLRAESIFRNGFE